MLNRGTYVDVSGFSIHFLQGSTFDHQGAKRVSRVSLSLRGLKTHLVQTCAVWNVSQWSDKVSDYSQ